MNTCVKFRDSLLRNEVCRAVTLFEHVGTNVRTGRSLYTLRGYNNNNDDDDDDDDDGNIIIRITIICTVY